MQDYKVSMDSNGLTVYGDFPPHLQAIALPDSYQGKKRYISLWLHRKDILEGMYALQCISIDKPPLLNKALFISGLCLFVKCFQSSASRSQLPTSIFNTDELKNLYDAFFASRNKHFIHDENSMIEATAFMLVDLDKENPEVFNASVVWNTVELDWHQEAGNLLYLMKIAHDYVCEQIDKTGDFIVKHFGDKSKDDLTKLGSPKSKLASTVDLSKKRDIKL